MSDDQAIEAYLRKAAESLAGAESECAAGRYNNCANRAYYACFQAAIAALIAGGFGPSTGDREWRHDAVMASFTERLINRRKVYPPTLRGVLDRAATLRATADYAGKHVSAVEARRGLRRSREFVAAVLQERRGR